MKKDLFLHVRIDALTDELLKDISAMSGANKSEIIRDLIKEKYQRSLALEKGEQK